MLLSNGKTVVSDFVGRKKISYQARVLWRSVQAGARERAGARAECGASSSLSSLLHIFAVGEPACKAVQQIIDYWPMSVHQTRVEKAVEAVHNPF
jgi:hypothetical protein